MISTRPLLALLAVLVCTSIGALGCSLSSQPIPPVVDEPKRGGEEGEGVDSPSVLDKSADAAADAGPEGGDAAARAVFKDAVLE